MTPTHILLIANAAAGSADDAAISAALEVLRDHVDVDVARTHDLDDLRSALAARAGRTPVVAGGDGSLHAVVGVLDALGELAATPVLGLIPLGTGNDLSRALGLPRDPREAASVVVTGRPLELDVIRDDTGELLVNVAHVGVGADAGRLAQPWKDRFGTVGLGALGYAVGGLLALVRTGGWRLELVADGRTVTSERRRILQVAIANGRTIGGGAEIAPDADVSDGLADVTISFATGPMARLRYGVAMRFGRHHSLDDVMRLRVREITVRSRRDAFTVNSDGELSPPIRQRTWRVEPRGYRLLVPSRSA